MVKTGSRPTDELVLRAVRGDGHAFTALWDSYSGELREYLHKTIKSLDAFYIDDICSRSFEKAFRQISTFDPSISRFSTWLRVIARNTALDVLEGENKVHPKNQVVYIDDDSKAGNVADSIPDRIDTPLDSIIKNEDQEEKTGYIGKLPELYREVAKLRIIDEMQYKEIAETTGLELNTVRTRLRRAREIIEKLSRQDEQV